MYQNKPGQGSVHHKGEIAVALRTEDTRLISEYEQLLKRAHAINISIHKQETTECLHTLYFGDDGVELRVSKKLKHRGQTVDFLTIDRRTGAGNLSKNNHSQRP